MFKWLRNMFKAEEKINFPHEFGLVTFTEDAMINGVFEDYTKEIRHYQGKDYKSIPYNRRIIESMEDDGIPVHDVTKKQIELPIFNKMNPVRVAYVPIK